MDTLTIALVTLVVLLVAGGALALRAKQWRMTKVVTKIPSVVEATFEPPTPSPALPRDEKRIAGEGVRGDTITIGNVGDGSAAAAGRGASAAATHTGDILMPGATKIVREPQRRAPSGSAITPSAVAKFVERGKIMDDLRAALRAETTAAIVGVGGMGGVGKTELAKYLAQEIETAKPGTVLWIDVTTRPLGDIHNEMARALGVTLPPTLDAKGRYAFLRAALPRSPFRLIVLDDIRNSFAPDLPLCLPPSPPCACLITSRRHELPGLPAGAMHALDVMTEPQALELVRGVSGLAEPVAREEAAAKELCRLCGYHPLALDLAARRLLKRLRDSRTPIATANQTLQDRLGGLRRGASPLESLEANFDLSYADLPAADQARFRRLAVFAPTGFSPAAAAAMWGEEENAARASIQQLQDASLTQPAEAAGRFRLHDLLIDYAAKKLNESGKADAAQRAHATHLIALFGQHYTDDPSSAPNVALERDNLRAAARWARASKQGDLLAELATRPRNWLYNVFRVNDDWLNWLNAARKLGIEDRRLEANVLQAIGDVQQFRKETDAALQSYADALTLYQQVGDKLGEANVLAAQGQSYVVDDQAHADELLNQAITIYQQIGDHYSVPAQIGNFGWALRRHGEKKRAQPYLLQAAELFEQMGLMDYAERHRKAAADD